MNLSKYYKKATLYPSVVVVFAMIVFSVVDDYDYKSEWMTADFVILISIITSIIYCLIISGLSLTIFLNKFTKVKNNAVLSFLAWFLLPFGFISSFLIHEIYYKIKYDELFDDVFVDDLILNIPFIIGLIWTYFKYKKSTITGKSISSATPKSDIFAAEK